MMLRLLALLSILLGAISACKSTGQKDSSELSAWGSLEEKQIAKQKFIQTIYDCVPLVTAVVPGASMIRLNSNAASERVIEQFVNRLIDNPSSKTERSAALLEYYYKERNRIFPPCGGEAAEYVLSEFAVRTNIIRLAFREDKELKYIAE